jgi:hypothetical protein
VAAKGDIYIADTGNNRVRKVDARTGTITTVAGSREKGQAKAQCDNATMRQCDIDELMQTTIMALDLPPSQRGALKPPIMLQKCLP